MKIKDNTYWDKVQIELNNHDTLILLLSLKTTVTVLEEELSNAKEALKNHPDLETVVTTCTNLINDRVKLHNELLAAYRSDYEHLKLEPIKLD